MAHLLAEVRVTGIRKILRAMNTEDPILAEPWTHELEAAVSDLEQQTHFFIPKNSGRMESTITTALQARPVPLWGRVRMRVTSDKGFRYGGALHGSQKVKFHYRHGPLAGQLTFGWMKKPLNAVLASMESRLAAAAREIEKRWAELKD